MLLGLGRCLLLLRLPLEKRRRLVVMLKLLTLLALLHMMLLLLKWGLPARRGASGSSTALHCGIYGVRHGPGGLPWIVLSPRAGTLNCRFLLVGT